MIITKLTPPIQEEKMILRSDIVMHLEDERNKRLILVAAGAGYGKSTTISQWAVNLTKKGISVAWLSLDERDDDPVTFIQNLVAAIRARVPSVLEEVEESLTDAYPTNISWAMTECINAMTNYCSAHVIGDDLKLALVLDDFHLITSQEIVKAIEGLVDFSPKGFQLILSSRELPELPIAYYRAKNWLVEIGAEALAFSQQEGRDFFKNSLPFSHKYSVRDALTRKTEGWVTGMQLLALSIKNKEDILRATESFTGNHPYVMHYLVGQVLEGLSEREQWLLMVTSIAKRFSLPLAEALMEEVTEHMKIGLQSDDLEGNNPVNKEVTTFLTFEKRHLFMTPLDDQWHWFRYHQLFADVLTSRLVKQLKMPWNNEQAITIESLHLTASRWFTENGYEIEGFEHALKTGKIDLCDHLLQSGTVPLMYRGLVSQAVKWFESLPLHELNARPWLWVMFASAGLYMGRFAEVDRRLKAADDHLSKYQAGQKIGKKQRPLTLKDVRLIKGHMASLRSVVFATQYNFEEAMRQATLALDYSNDTTVIIQSSANWSLGYSKLELKAYKSAYVYLLEAKVLSEQNGPMIIWLMSVIGLGKLKQYAMSYEGALEIYQKVFDFKGHKGYPITCDAYLAKAHICFEKGELNEAERLLEEARHLVAGIDRTDRKALCQIFKAKLLMTRGRYQESFQLLEQAESYCLREDYQHRLDQITKEKGRILLKTGHINAVGMLIKLRYEENLDIDLKLAKGQWQEAIKLLETRMDNARKHELIEEGFRALVLHALACYKEGLLDKGLESLQKAMALAIPNKSVMSFVECGPSMVVFIKNSGLDQVYPGFLQGLQGLQRSMMMDDKDQYLEALSPRELEVLILISRGCSNEAIANRLFLAVSSVKGINQRIFSKLQVGRRTEAVAKARQLSWID